MSNNATIKLTLEQRKMILQLMDYSYSIPEEYHRCVADAIKRYATKNYSDEVIYNMVRKNQSIANSGFLIREDSLALFRGKFAEWLACIEYNAMKNSGSVVMTIVNPDESSKADLLHFIKVGDEFKAVAGPDIKSGGSTYVFNQWKKIVTSRRDIPMVDFDDVLTTEEGLSQLTKKQRNEFEELSEKYPNKKPIPSIFTKQDELRLRTDYFKNILEIEGSFKYSPEITNRLKDALAKQNNENLIQSDWTEFNKKCKEIFDNIDFSISDKKNIGTEKVNANPILPSKKKTFFEGIKQGAKKIGLGKIVKGAAATAIAVAGVAVAVKNPEVGKKMIDGAKNIVKNTSKIVDETRKSPVMHEVGGYVRKNGTKVASYVRGKK